MKTITDGVLVTLAGAVSGLAFAFIGADLPVAAVAGLAGGAIVWWTGRSS